MISWTHHNTYPAIDRRDIAAAPLLDLVLAMAMLIIGSIGYQAVTAARITRASGGLSSGPTFVLRAAVTAAGGAR